MHSNDSRLPERILGKSFLQAQVLHTRAHILAHEKHTPEC